MTDQPADRQTFAYRAQTSGGNPLTGAIEAVDADEARWQLQGVGLHVLELAPAEQPAPARPLRGSDFEAFNQQLASLTEAGMPIEQGLRLIAQDMRTGRLAAAVRQVAEELEKGKPLEEAFEAHAGNFPPLYGQVLAAGVKSGNLSGVLLNLGRHLEMIQRLKRTLWRVSAYPIVMLVLIAGVFIFAGAVIAPGLRLLVVDMVNDFDMEFQMPLPTLAMLWANEHYVNILTGMGVGLMALTGLLMLMQATAKGRALRERLALKLPLIGPLLRRMLVARWCDAMQMGVQSGLDLTQAIDMACDAVASPAVRDDCRGLRVALNTAQPMKGVEGMVALTPAVAVAIDNARSGEALYQAMGSLRDLSLHQTEYRLDLLDAVLRPAMMIFIGVAIAWVVTAMLAPMPQFIRLIQSVSS